MLRPDEMAQRHDRFHLQFAQTTNDGAIMLERGYVETARLRLDARPRDRKTKRATAQFMSMVHVFFPTIPKVSSLTARHATWLLFPNIPNIRGKMRVVGLGLVIGNCYAEEEGIG